MPARSLERRPSSEDQKTTTVFNDGDHEALETMRVPRTVALNCRKRVMLALLVL